jgi:hypothetical protein
MGKTLEELFKSKILSNGQTAKQKYEIQNSKENKPSNASGFMNGVVFPLQQIARRNLSNRTGETFIEEEVTGLRILNTIASPQIYGTDIIRLTTKKSNLTEIMIQSSGGTTDNGIIGNLISKAKKEALKITSKLGIEFPVVLIPTSLYSNTKFNTGQGNGGEQDTMKVLAEIKKDGAGSLLGKFLAQNVKGTPKQIGNQLLGSGIDFLKQTVGKKLIGSPSIPGQNFAKKINVNADSTLYAIRYDSATTYTDLVLPWLKNDDILKRNDLSSIVKAKEIEDLKKQSNLLQSQTRELLKRPPSVTTPITVDNNPFAKPSENVAAAATKIKSKLLSSGLPAQQLLAADKVVAINGGIDADTTYEDIVDWSGTDIETRNDLSTLYKAIIDPSAGKQSKKKYYSPSSAGASTNGDKSMDVIRGITSNKGDFVNTVGVYKGDEAKDQKGKSLDDYDFIALKFTSPIKGMSVNFRATISGLAETFAPSWDSAKFIGSPFPYYTYTQIERSVTFNFKVYSYNSKEHKTAWERLSFLANLTYPQNYAGSGNAAVPPILRFTLGDLYHSKECFIDSLSYTVDDNTPWEIGLNGSDTANYKLPMIVDVAITLKFLQSKTSTFGPGKGLYSFSNGALNSSTVTFNQPSTNTTNQNTPQPNASSNFTQKAPDGAVSNPIVTTNTTKIAVNKSNPGPTYKIEVNSAGDGFSGKVYANGKQIHSSLFENDYSSAGEDGKTIYKGQAAVKEYLKYKSKTSGWFGSDGTRYDPSNNVS